MGLLQRSDVAGQAAVAAKLLLFIEDRHAARRDPRAPAVLPNDLELEIPERPVRLQRAAVLSPLLAVRNCKFNFPRRFAEEVERTEPRMLFHL